MGTEIFQKWIYSFRNIDRLFFKKIDGNGKGKDFLKNGFCIRKIIRKKDGNFTNSEMVEISKVNPELFLSTPMLKKEVWQSDIVGGTSLGLKILRIHVFLRFYFVIICEYTGSVFF